MKWEIINFNNNNNSTAWSYVKCFKKSASNVTASVITKEKIAKPVTKITINASKQSGCSGNVYVYASSTLSFDASALATFNLSKLGTTAKDVEVTIDGAQPNMYYKIDFVGSNTSSNGGLWLYSVEYQAEKEPETPELTDFNWGGYEKYNIEEDAPFELTVGESLDFSDLVKDDEDIAITYEIKEGDDIVKILNGNIIEALEEGNAKIVASWTKTATYNAGGTTFNILVSAASTDPVEYSKVFEDLTMQEFETLKLDLGKKYPTDLIFVSDKKEVVTVSDDYVVTAVAPGTATINYMWEDDAFLPCPEDGKSFTVTVTEKPRDEYKPSFAAFATTGLELTTNNTTYQLELGEPHPEDMLFISENEEVATIDETTGLITINKAGTTKISCSWDQDPNFKEGYTEFVLTVKKAVEQKQFVLDLSDKDKLISNMSGDEPIVFTWSQGTHINTAPKAYDESIRFYVGNTLMVSFISDEYASQYYLEKIEFTYVDNASSYPYNLTVDCGTITGNGGKAVWENNKDNIEIEPSKVTFTNSASSKHTRITGIKVTYHKKGKKDVSLSWSKTKVNLPLTWDFEEVAPVLTVTSSNDSATELAKKAVKYSSSVPEVAYFDDNGSLHIVATGTTSIKAYVEESDVFNSAEASYELTVEPKKKKTYKPEWAVLEESGLTLTTATDLYDLELGKQFPDMEISSSAENVATVSIVDGVAEIKVMSPGETDITFKWEDSDDYFGDEISFTLKVTRELQAVVLIHTSKTADYKGSIEEKVYDNEVPSTIPGVVTFNYSKGACKEDFRVYKGESFSITSKNGITLAKVVAKYKANGTPVVTVAEDNGTVTVKDGFITWEGETTDGFTMHTDLLIQMSYIEIYYYEEGLDPTKTKVDLDWGIHEATATIGQEFVAPQLSVKVTRAEKLDAAKAAVRYRSEFPEIASIDELTGEISIHSEGETNITAYIPDDNEDFAANAEVFNLVVDDPYTIVINSKSFGSPTSYSAVSFKDTSRNVTYSGVLVEQKEGSNAYMQLNPGNSSGKASSIVVSANPENVIIESVAIKFDGKTDPTTVAGLNIYGSDECFPAPVKSASKEYTVDDSLLINEDVIKESQTITVNKMAFAIVPAVASAQRVYSITVRYSDKTVETIEAVTIGHEEADIRPAQIHNGVEVDEASVFMLEDLAVASNSAAVAFEYEGVSWTVPTVDGKASFTASYLPAPKKDSKLVYYGVDENGNRTTAQRSATVNCGHQFYEPYTYTNEGHKLVARFDNEKNRRHLFLHLELTHKMTHANADNKKAPHVIAYNVESANHAEKEVVYVRGLNGLHTATIMEFIDIPVRSDITHGQVLDLLTKFEFTDEHNFDASAQVYYPVLVSAEPEIALVNPAFFAARKSLKAAPAVQMVAGNGDAANDDSTTSKISVSKDELTMPIEGGLVTGLEDVLVDAEAGEVEYYNLQGVRVVNPGKGEVMIRRQGSKVEKVVIK